MRKRKKKKIKEVKEKRYVCPGCGVRRVLVGFIRQHTPHAHLKLRIKVCAVCYEKNT